MSIIGLLIFSIKGKLLLYRHLSKYNLQSKSQIECHILNFLLLYKPTQESSIIINNTYTYLYLHLSQSEFISIITTTKSNIIIDMQVLKLCHRVIIDICGINFNEQLLRENALKIFESIDEIYINDLKYAKNIYDVKTNVNMIKLGIMEIKKKKEEKKEKEKE